MGVVACINIDERSEICLKEIGSRFEVTTFNSLANFSKTLETSALVVNISQFDLEILNTLKSIKNIYPSLAILISSNRYIELLSFWCLRNKILDYVILPDEKERLKETLHSLNYVSKFSGQENREPLNINSTLSSINSFNELNFAQNKTEKAVRYINRNYTHEIRVETLAAECNYSVAAFSSIFKKEYGTSAMEYVNIHRIAVAKQMLAETKLPISNIADRCGFEDVSYFVKVFKCIQKVTPSKYRKNLYNFTKN